ncbi:MAG: TspO/MBR family protein [Chloroflexota bacterium]
MFGPVWTLLCTLMGVAAWLVWRAGWERPEVRTAEKLFAAQLALNALWTPLFFGRQAFGLALAELLVLWGLILATLVRFYRIRPLAGLLLVPYLLWVSYASTLNAGVWWLNRK